MKKIKKCTPNATNGAHLCAKSVGFVCRSVAIYYINVRQIVGGEIKCAIVAYLEKKAVSRDYPAQFDIEIKRV